MEASINYEYVMNVGFRRNFKHPILKIKHLILQLKENSMCYVYNSQIKNQGNIIQIIFSASPKDCEAFKDSIGKFADLEILETRRARQIHQSSNK